MLAFAIGAAGKIALAFGAALIVVGTFLGCVVLMIMLPVWIFARQ